MNLTLSKTAVIKEQEKNVQLKNVLSSKKAPLNELFLKVIFSNL